MNFVSHTKKTALLLTCLIISYSAAAFAPDGISSSSSTEAANDFAYLQLSLNSSISEFTRDYKKEKTDELACHAVQCKGENSKCCSNNGVSWCVKVGEECNKPE